MMCTGGCSSCDCTPRTDRNNWQRAADRGSYSGESPSGTLGTEQDFHKARKANSRQGFIVFSHSHCKHQSLDILSSSATDPAVWFQGSRFSALSMENGQEDKSDCLIERSGEATSQGEHSQFGHVRGDITGEQR